MPSLGECTTAWWNPCTSALCTPLMPRALQLYAQGMSHHCSDVYTPLRHDAGTTWRRSGTPPSAMSFRVAPEEHPVLLTEALLSSKPTLWDCELNIKTASLLR